MNVQQEDMACQKKLEKVLKFKQEIINPRCIIVYEKKEALMLYIPFCFKQQESNKNFNIFTEKFFSPLKIAYFF